MPDSHRPTPFDDLEPFAVLTAQAIAERLGVDPRSVRRAIARGELVASRTCGIRVLACDAAAWWQARTVAVQVDIAQTRDDSYAISWAGSAGFGDALERDPERTLPTWGTGP